MALIGALHGDEDACSFHRPEEVLQCMFVHLLAIFSAYMNDAIIGDQQKRPTLMTRCIHGAHRRDSSNRRRNTDTENSVESVSYWQRVTKRVTEA